MTDRKLTITLSPYETFTFETLAERAVADHGFRPDCGIDIVIPLSGGDVTVTFTEGHSDG